MNPKGDTSLGLLAFEKGEVSLEGFKNSEVGRGRYLELIEACFNVFAVAVTNGSVSITSELQVLHSIPCTFFYF